MCTAVDCTSSVWILNRDLIEKVSFICSQCKKWGPTRFLQFYLWTARGMPIIDIFLHDIYRKKSDIFYPDTKHVTRYMHVIQMLKTHIRYTIACSIYNTHFWNRRRRRRCLQHKRTSQSCLSHNMQRRAFIIFIKTIFLEFLFDDPVSTPHTRPLILVPARDYFHYIHLYLYHSFIYVNVKWRTFLTSTDPHQNILAEPRAIWKMIHLTSQELRVFILLPLSYACYVRTALQHAITSRQNWNRYNDSYQTH